MRSIIIGFTNELNDFETNFKGAFQPKLLEQNVNKPNTLVKNIDSVEVQDNGSDENEFDHLQSYTRYCIDINAGYEQMNTEDILQSKCLKDETLISIDYFYHDATLPLIFVNPYVSGISLKEQCDIVSEDIKEVLHHFVDAKIPLNDTTITEFFQCNPGTMLYSPQLVRTIVLLEEKQRKRHSFIIT